jgi:hypothetical protein
MGRVKGARFHLMVEHGRPAWTFAKFAVAYAIC